MTRFRRNRPRRSSDNELLEFEKTFSDFGASILADPAYEVHMKRRQELSDINKQLLWPYIISEEIPSVKGYLESHVRLKYEQVFFYLQAIIDFRTGVHFNRPSLRPAARRMFAPIWSAPLFTN